MGIRAGTGRIRGRARSALGVLALLVGLSVGCNGLTGIGSLSKVDCAATDCATPTTDIDDGGADDADATVANGDGSDDAGATFDGGDLDASDGAASDSATLACMPSIFCANRCGMLENFCGVMLDCGACPGGGPCTSGSCGCAPEPDAQACAGKACGTVKNRCGQTVACGKSGSTACAGADEVCQAAGTCCVPGDPCAGRCNTTLADGCGMAVACPGGCGVGQACDGTTCCTPNLTASCAGLGCGPVVDNCHQNVTCPDTCSAAGPCHVGLAGPNACCAPSCAGKLCTASDGCVSACAAGSGCVTQIRPNFGYGDPRFLGLCTTAAARQSVSCDAAIDRACRDPSVGFAAGYPVQTPPPGVIGAQCLAPPAQLVQFATSQVLALQPSCAPNYYSVNCAAAIDALCINGGFGAGGFGPVEVSASVVTGVCIPAIANFVDRRSVATTAGCTGVGHSAECDAEVDNTCLGLGYSGGRGPVEIVGGTMIILCVH